MTISEYILELEKIRAEHGELRVTKPNGNSEVSNAKPSVRFVRINKGRQRRIEYWSPYIDTEEAQGEKVVGV